MLETHLPTADLSFILEQLLKCDKVHGSSQHNVGPNMTTFVIKGNKPMHKRHIIITHEDGVINFNQATALAINFQFMGNLLEWFESNRAWKEGAYVDNEIQVNNNNED